MALEYQVALQGVLTNIAIDHWRSELFGVHTPALVKHGDFWQGEIPGAVVIVRNISGSSWASEIADVLDLNVTTGITVRFRNEQSEVAYLSLFKLLGKIVEVRGDFALLANGEHAILLRRDDGKLQVNRRWETWVLTHLNSVAFQASILVADLPAF